MIKELMKTSNKSKGFTLLEVLLVVAAIAILAGIVIVAINPSKQLAAARNSQRRADVNTIINAVYQYTIDYSGNLPSNIYQDATSTCDSTARKQICKSGATGTCNGGTDLTVLTTNQMYLASLPIDPSNPLSNPEGTGYYIIRNYNGRVTVCAPTIEPAGNPMISVTR